MYVLVSLGSAAPVVQESNKAIMDLKVNLGFCRNVKIRVFLAHVHQTAWKRSDFSFIYTRCEYLPTLVVWLLIQYFLPDAKSLFNLCIYMTMTVSHIRITD